mmetsp:Transcript_45418/g.97087  ORF Transcript_45418/g.97087 Transcript_45418/m.97087 type:complete len:208 (-) Transcript_45418:2353-2976(-)
MGRDHREHELIDPIRHQRLQQPGPHDASIDGDHLLLDHALCLSRCASSARGRSEAGNRLHEREELHGWLERRARDQQEFPSERRLRNVEVELDVRRPATVGPPERLHRVLLRVLDEIVLQLGDVVLCEDLSRESEAALKVELLVHNTAGDPHAGLKHASRVRGDVDVCLATLLPEEHIPQDDVDALAGDDRHADADHVARRQEDFLI